MSSPELTGWLLTYAVHSTVLLVLAWLVASRVRSHRARETLWKTALFGAFLTATGQSLLSVSPLAGRMVVPAPAVTESTNPAQPSLASGAIATRPSLEAATPDISSPVENSRTLPQPGTVLLFAWGLGAVLLLGRYLTRRARFIRRIGDRREVTSGPAVEMLEQLRRAAGITRPIRLTASIALPSPVALGSGEIAVPEAALTDLDSGQQRSMLAHELAHLDRGDPAWLTAACLVECIGFLQPLNRLARRRMQESAEYLCDEWAVRSTGSGVLLAKCLAKVAEWLESSPRSVPVAGMAEASSHLVSRVRRLLDGTPFPRSPGKKTLAGASVAIMALTILAIPGVSLARHGSALPQQTGGGSETGSAQEGSQQGSTASADSGRAIVDALIGVAKDPNVEVRRAAIRSLGQHRHRASLPTLREALRDADAEVRASALEGLSEMQDAASADAIAALLKDPSKEVRANAIDALTNLELSSPPAGLREALKDPDAEVRHQAAHAVGHFEDAAAVPALRAMLDDPNAEVREAAVEALASIRNEPAIQALILALKAKDPKVRQAAADALGKRN
jgi:beta-lactamase regulating signal transducer with metallopeptidase domain